MNSNFVLQTSHPLIQSEQTYVLDRKLISIHSVDRDYQKWPNSNNFGVDLGEAFHNVQSMRLINFAVPANNYTFSKAYQNTKMSFTYNTKLRISFGAGWIPLDAHIDGVLDAIFGGTSGSWTLPAPNGQVPNDITIYVLQQGGLWLPVLLPLNTATTNIDPWNNGGGGMELNDPQIEIRWNPAEFSIEIPEGAYSPTNLASTIETLMNEAVFNASSGAGFNCFPPNATLTSAGMVLSNTNPLSNWYNDPTNVSSWGLKPFVLNFNSVTNKLLFGIKQGEFSLKFGKQEIYGPTCDVNKAIFHQYTKWGLPSYLGFNKSTYIGQVTDLSNNADRYLVGIGGLYLDFEAISPWLIPEGIAEIEDISGIVVNTILNKEVADVSANYNLDINGEDALYMEIDRYNSIDEIYPYSERTGHLYNNDLGHRVNGSFAKIPLTHVPFGQEMGSRNNFVLNVFHSDPPIQRIDRLKFIFRFHDGRLVDFKNLPFSFTLEFNMLKDEQERGKHVRVPPLYNL